MELGPLLQRDGALARTHRRRPRPVPGPLRPPGRVRCPARLRDPFRDPVQLRQAADPRMGAAAGPRHRNPRTRPSRSSGGSTTAWPAGAGSGSTPAGVPGTCCPTTSTETTAAGTTRRPSTSTASSSRQTSPPSSRSSSTSWPTSPTSSAAPRQNGAKAATWWSVPCWTSCGRAPSSSRSAPCPAAPAPQQACSTSCPSFSVTGFRTTSARSWRIGCRTTSPRTASPPSRCPPRSTRPTATGAARSGHRPQPSSRTACDAAGSKPSQTWSAPVSESCAKAPASPRTSTPAPVRASGTAPTRGPPRSISSSPRITSSERLTAGVQKRHPPRVLSCPAVEAGVRCLAGGQVARSTHRLSAACPGGFMAPSAGPPLSCASGHYGLWMDILSLYITLCAVLLVVGYFIIRLAVRHGVMDAHRRIQQPDVGRPGRFLP